MKKEGDAWTRRDILRGSFLKRLLGGAGDSGAGDSGAAESSVTAPEPGAVVMRYPRTAEDVRRAQPAGPRGGELFPVLRPPGAVSARQFLELCTRCGDCARACPYGSIQEAPGRLRALAGTPIIDPISQPCWLCEDMPCISACETGALDPTLEVQLGTAAIQEQTCLAHQGGVCTTCAERCPVEGAIVLSGGRPTVDQDRCNGCGVCQYVCPAPENAILLMPMFTRPTPRRDDVGTPGEAI